MNLQFVSKTTLQTVQREIVIPVVDHSWTVMQDHIFKKIKDSNRCLGWLVMVYVTFLASMQNIVHTPY